MKGGNQTLMGNFIFVGITQDPVKKILLFALFLFLYVATVMGNIVMILVIWVRPRLHTPMYFFISNLSFIDLLMSSVIVPNTLQNVLAEKAEISLIGCGAQIYGFIALGCADCSILSVMAYDRYTAICHPLYYVAVMSKERCCMLVAISYVASLIYSLTHTVPTMSLNLCDNQIQHFICEIPTLLKLACEDTEANYIILFAVGGLFTVFFFSAIIVSYIFILLTILKFHSVESRYKTFSTCGSHLFTFSLLYGIVSMMYFQPRFSNATAHKEVMSVFYTVVLPFLNPSIYSIRNKDVKEALIVITTPSFSRKYKQ